MGEIQSLVDEDERAFKEFESELFLLEKHLDAVRQSLLIIASPHQQ